MFAKIPNARIAAIRAAVPSQEKRIEDELEFYGGSLKKAMRAKAMIGSDRRRLAWPGQTASDLCFAAAKKLLLAHQSVRNETDAIIFVSQSPDHDLPATACILQEKLSLPQTCAAFDVNQGCAGYVYGLWLASSLINSGCRHVLLLAGDACCRTRDVRNRVIAPIFGDGGSATLVSMDEKAPALTFSIGTDGSGFDDIIVPAGRSRLPFSADFCSNRLFFEDIHDKQGFPWRLSDTYMDGQAVFAFTLGVVPAHIREFLGKTGTRADEIDHFVLHQANRQIIAEIAKKAGLPLDRTPSESFSRYGNLSSASIPAALCDLFGASGSSGRARILLCGYGVGLSWASCLWDASDCDCSPVLDVPPPADKDATQECQIEFWRRKIMGETNADE